MLFLCTLASDTKHVVFSHTMQFSNSWWRLTEFPMTSLNSDINCPMLAHTPQVKGSVPQARIHSDATHKSQAINWGSPPLPPQAQWFARMVHRPPESTLLTVTDLLWGILNDTDEQPDEEIHGARVWDKGWKAPEQGVSVPVEFGVHHPQRHGCVLVYQPGRFLSPFSWVFWSLHDLLKHWPLVVICSPAPLSSLRGKGGSQVTAFLSVVSSPALGAFQKTPHNII